MNNLYLMGRHGNSPINSSFYMLIAAPDENEARMLAAGRENDQSCAADWYNSNLTMAMVMPKTETELSRVVTEIHNGPNLNPAW
jgi:hypothetical protein